MTDLERGKQLYEEAKKLEFLHAWHDGMYAEELGWAMFHLPVGQKGHDMVAEAAIHGYPEAQYQLGLFYFFDKDHKPDMPTDYTQYDAWKKAVEDEQREGLMWMRRAAEQCFVEACLTLGHMYLNGRDIVLANESEAFSWFSLAAQVGDTEGMYWLGRCYYHGWGTAENNEAAFQQFLKAKDAGGTMMWKQLGECYMHGWGTGKNTYAAIEAYRKAIEKKDGFSDAARAGLASIYAGQNGFEYADPAKAFELASAISSDSGGAYNVAQKILSQRAEIEEDYRQWKQASVARTASASSQSSSGGCYVATAVYGSYDCPQVWTLRRFRDDRLLPTWYGKAFVRCYYAVSPTLVRWFGDCGWFQNFWRGKLDRLVTKLQSEGVEDTPYNDKM